MSDVINIVNAGEQLRPFMNKDGIIEIVVRDAKKRFAYFQKIAISNVPKGEEEALLEKVIQVMNKNKSLVHKNLKLLTGVTKLSQLNLLLSGFNLCATCAGFAIMYDKLDKMSGQINQMMEVIKKGNDVQTHYEFGKVIAEHRNMLDSRKTQKYYTEEQMRKLVDDEFSVINMLIEVFMKDLSGDKDNLLFSIYSLASMFAVSLRYFDELYYFNNKEAIGDGDVWHSSHNSWMAVFEKLSSQEFVNKVQDHGVFDLNMNTKETDLYYISLLDQAKELAEDVEDNQTLIQTLDSEKLLAEYNVFLNKGVAEGIREAFEQTAGALENENVHKVYNDTMKQMAIAV